MTATTFDPGATHAQVNLARLLVGLAVATMLVVASFVVGRTSADDAEPRPAVPAAETPAPAAGDLDVGQPVETCTIGRAC